MFVIEKKVSEKFPIGIDFTNKLDGENITSYEVSSTDSSAIDPNSVTLTDNTLSVWVNKDNAYRKPFFIKFHIVTNTGKEFTASCRVNVVSDYT